MEIVLLVGVDEGVDVGAKWLKEIVGKSGKEPDYYSFSYHDMKLISYYRITIRELSSLVNFKECLNLTKPIPICSFLSYPLDGTEIEAVILNVSQILVILI